MGGVHWEWEQPPGPGTPRHLGEPEGLAGVARHPSRGPVLVVVLHPHAAPASHPPHPPHPAAACLRPGRPGRHASTSATPAAPARCRRRSVTGTALRGHARTALGGAGGGASEQGQTGSGSGPQSAERKARWETGTGAGAGARQEERRRSGQARWAAAGRRRGGGGAAAEAYGQAERLPREWKRARASAIVMGWGVGGAGDGKSEGEQREEGRQGGRQRGREGEKIVSSPTAGDVRHVQAGSGTWRACVLSTVRG